jgi:hypothetical protein
MGKIKYTTNNTKSNISELWIDFRMFGIFIFIYIYSHYNFREPAVPRTPPSQGTYGSPNPSLHGGDRLGISLLEGRGSGNRRFPDLK